MKITVTKEALQRSLRIVSTTLVESALDASAHVLVVVSPTTGLTLKTYQAQACSSTPLEYCKVEGLVKETLFSIPGKRLRAWLQTVQDETLTLEWDTKETLVRATSSLGEVVFLPKDPRWFPRKGWDKLEKEAKKIATIEAFRLVAAIKHLKQFVIKGETTVPKYSVVESLHGVLHGTDAGGISGVWLRGLETSKLRIHSQNMTPLLKYLSILPEDEPIEVLEHEQAYLLRSSTGILFGENRVDVGYGGPALTSVTSVRESFTLTISKEVFNRAIQHLWSAADWDAVEEGCPGGALILAPEKGGLVLKCKAQTGHPISVSVPATIEGDISEIHAMRVDKKYLQKLINAGLGDQFVVAVQGSSSRGGWMITDYETEPTETAPHGDRYLTLMKWQTL